MVLRERVSHSTSVGFLSLPPLRGEPNQHAFFSVKNGLRKKIHTVEKIDQILRLINETKKAKKRDN
jgi:hypothetical protein